MCLIQSSLEKMIEKLLSGLEAEEWGGTLQRFLGAGEKILQGYFPPHGYWETWVLCSESPWFPVPGVCKPLVRCACCMFRLDQTHIAILC